MAIHTPIPTNTLEKFITFGDLLRFLRRHTGLTQMDLAIAVGYSESQISRLEQNQRLPDIITIEARFVSALGLEEEPQAVARLLDLAANVRRDDAPATGISPYKGLNFFDEADSDLFVGREDLTSKLTDHILAMTSRGSTHKMRFLAIVGASGSGKSSLVRAGLVSSLRWNKASANWQIHILTPTLHPLESLAAALTQESISVTAATVLTDDLRRDPRSLQVFSRRKMGLNGTSHVLLVVDQFEELFSLCHSEQERAAFIDNLLTAANDEGGPVVIVITLRADFYAPCAKYPQLREALATNQEYIGTMNAKELRRAIEEPAQRGRWELEPGLVDLLLHDVGHEPGALPLLSHALLETWQRRRGRIMTLSGYTASGGVRGAIAETAEAVFADQFTHEQQAIARRIFLRLTELGDEAGSGDTRRRATFDELIAKPEEATSTQAVIKALADARLIITSENSAEVAHEALIREWPTLHGWLEENREWMRLHRQLTEAAIEWQRAGHVPDLLFRGSRLAQLHEWAGLHAEEMNTLEQEFLDASQQRAQDEAAERESQRLRELESAQKLAETQNRAAQQLRRRAYFLVAALGLTAITAVVAGIFASRNATLAGQNLIIAQTAQAANIQSIASFKQTEAQRLAAEANSLSLNNGDTNLIALLSIRSLKTRYTPIGDAILSSLTTFEMPPRQFKGHTADVWSVDISPDGKYLVTASDDKTTVLWDLATGQSLQTFQPCKAEQGGARFSPDGKAILVGCEDQTANLIDIASGQTVQTFSGHTGGVDWVDFSPDGKRIITAGGDDKTARIWDVASGQTLFILKSNADYLPRVAFSPDGKYVFTDRLWDAVTGEAIPAFPEQPNAVSCVAFSPDSKYVATGSDDGIARIWDVSSGQLVHEFTGHTGPVQGIKFSPDGSSLLTGSADQTTRLWDTATGQAIHIFHDHRGGVQGVTFSPDGKQIAAASDDLTAMVWNLDDSAAPASAPSGITLHLAVADQGGRSSEPYVLEFIDQVKTLSNGIMTIEPTWGAANSDDVNFESGVIQLVKEGKYDLGLAGSRAFDLENIDGFQALQTPLLIDNNALAEAVTTSDVAKKMLDHLTSTGLIGLTLWPEDLRHPFSFNPDKPLLSPQDFAGLNIRTPASKLSYQLIQALGGTPGLGENQDGAESGLRQGASLSGSPVATGNVTFFAKYQVLFGNQAALEKLSKEQRSILIQAATAAQKKAIAEHPTEVDAGKVWCAAKGTIVLANIEQVTAFEAAAKPVVDQLEKDPFTAEQIAEIEQLKSRTPASQGADVCES